MRWMTLATVIMLALAPVAVTWAQQPETSGATPTDPATPPSTTPQSAPTPAPTPTTAAPQSVPAPAPTTTTGVPGAPAQIGTQIDSRSLVGSTVRGEDGKDLGRVANLMIDAADGKVSAVVITVGKVLGVGGTGITLGGKDVTVPWSSIRLARDQQNVVVTLVQPVMPRVEGSSSASPSASPSTR